MLVKGTVGARSLFPDVRTALAPLVQLSARVGRDPLLVQASSGNTSMKLDGVLWIKALGQSGWRMRIEMTCSFPSRWRKPESNCNCIRTLSPIRGGRQPNRYPLRSRPSCMRSCRIVWSFTCIR